MSSRKRNEGLLDNYDGVDADDNAINNVQDEEEEEEINEGLLDDDDEEEEEEERSWKRRNADED